MSSNPRISNPNVASSNLAAPSTQSKALPHEHLTGCAQLQSSDIGAPGSTFRRTRLRALILNLLTRADRESQPKKRFALLEEARDLSKRYREQKGFKTMWSAVSFAGVCGAILLIVAHQRNQRDFTFSAPADKFQILRRFDAYHYTFRYLRNGIVISEFPAVSCPNYEPQLSAGQTLTYLHYMDLGRCWDILPEGYGYSFETKDGVHPTLAPNCFVNERDVTECKPNQLEARF